MSNKLSINKDVAKVINRLNKIPYHLREKERKKILRKAAKPLTRAAKANVPRSNKPTHRYSNGKIIATYYPGNLRRSIKVLPLRRTINIFVGPHTKGGSGNFKGRRVDGYYANFVEKGTVFQQGVHYMENAYKSTKGEVFRLIQTGVTIALKSYIR